MNVAIVCIGLLGLLLFGLGMAVSLTRARTHQAAGDSGSPTDPLYKIVRAHGNTAEYAPLLALLIYLVALSSPATWVLWVMGAATASRFLLVAGILLSDTLEKANPLRFVGALGTYLCGLALAVALLMSFE